MSVTAEDVLIRFVGEDQVSPTLRNLQQGMGQLDRSGQSAFSNMSQGAGQFSSFLDSISDKLGVIQNIFYSVFGIAGLNALYDQTVGVAALKQGYEVMLTKQVGGAKNAKELLDYTRDFAQSTPIMFREYAYGLTLLSSRQKMTNDEMKKFLPIMSDISVAYQLKNRSPQEAMIAVSAALMGNFRMLNMELGITKEQLMKQGWDGTKEDVNGFADAMDRVLEMTGKKGISTVDTFNVKMSQLKGQFRAAASQLGDILLPVLTTVVKTLTDFLKALPRELKIGAVAFAGLLFLLMAIVPWLPSIAGGISMIAGALGLKSIAVGGAMSATELYTLALMRNNTYLWLQTTGLGKSAAAASGLYSPAMITAAGATTGASTAQVGFIGKLKLMKASIMSSLPLLAALAAIIGGIAVALLWYNHVKGEEAKRIAAANKVLDETNDRYLTLLKRKLELNRAMEKTETGSDAWKELNEDLKNVNKQLDEIIAKRAQANIQKIDEQAKWENWAAWVPAPKPRENEAAKFAEKHHLMTPKQGLMTDAGLTVLKSEKEWVDKINKKYQDLEKTKGSLTKEDKQRWKDEIKNQKEISDEYLKQMGFSDRAIKSLRHLQEMQKRYGDAIKKVKDALIKLITAISRLLILIFGGKEAVDEFDKSASDGEGTVDDLAVAIEGVSIALDGMIKFLDWVVGGIMTLIGWIETAIGWVEAFKQSLADAWGYITGGVGGFAGGATPANVPKGLPANPQGGTISVGQAKTGVNNMNPAGKLFRENSPITMFEASGLGPQLMRFPQLTPEFLKGAEEMGKNMKKGGKGKGDTHYHTHNTSIDARHLSASQLKGLLVEVFEDLGKGNTPTSKLSPTGG